MRVTELPPQDRLALYQAYPFAGVTHLGDLAIMQARFVAERAVPENPRASLEKLDEFMKTVERLYHKEPQVLVGGETFEVPLDFFERCVAAAMALAVSIQRLPLPLQGLVMTNWVGDVLAEVRRSINNDNLQEASWFRKVVEEFTLRVAVLAALPPKRSHKYIDGVYPVFDLRQHGNTLRVTIAVGTRIDELLLKEEDETDGEEVAYN